MTVESLDASLAGQSVQVFRIPEAKLRRLIFKIKGRAGFPQVPLLLSGTGSAGPLSEVWNAAQFPPPEKPTRYVASLADGGASGPLIVSDKVIWETDGNASGKVGIDGGALSAATGLPLPVQLDVNGSLRKRLKGTAYGIVDPHIEMVWMTTGGGDRSIEEYLEPYLRFNAEALGLPSDQLLEALRDEYSDCFERPAVIRAEFMPSAFDIDEGQSVDVDLDLYPQAVGRTLAAIGLSNTEDGTLLTVSDLMLLTFTEDGFLFVDP